MINQQTSLFLEELKQKTEVLGVILFGSWARGNNRPGSDVDLVVILDEGYSRTVDKRDGQTFEIVYTTEEKAFEFWESHRDDAAGLWEVAQILYDRDGTIANLKEKATHMISGGKKAIDEDLVGQLRFDAEDSFRYVEEITKTDPTTASLILNTKVAGLTGLFFDLRQLWTPAPKQRLSKIKAIKPEFYKMLQDFYLDGRSMAEKLDIAKKIVPLVFMSLD